MQVQRALENSNEPHARDGAVAGIVRHLEAMQKVALGYDEMLETSIRKLGEPT
jgi:hypothetical protein